MFGELVNYVRTHLNMIDFLVYGRYVQEVYDDNQGGRVVIDVFDHRPQVVHRPGLEPVCRPVIHEEGKQ